MLLGTKKWGPFRYFHNNSDNNNNNNYYIAQSAAFLVSDLLSRLCDEEGVGLWVLSAFKNPGVPTQHKLFDVAERHMSILAVSLF